MEIEQAMNTHATDGKLAITDATAVFAWCETQDEAAAIWLCEKYRPLIAHIVARETRNQAARAFLVDETLSLGLANMDADIALCRVGSFFARTALQICRQEYSAFVDDDMMVAA